MAARFITLEGIDGAGKSSHLQWLAGQLRARGITICMTREPGGTVLGENLRALLLDPAQPVLPETEMLLMFAARNEHLERVILPALARGEWVLCDRFTDATFAYQGGGRGIADTRIEVLERWVQGERQPDLTLYFDVPPELARQRLDAAREADRFEQEQAAFFVRVRDAYLARARRFPQRIRVIDSSVAIELVRDALGCELRRLLST
jgi:dTMP kinase